MVRFTFILKVFVYAKCTILKNVKENEEKIHGNLAHKFISNLKIQSKGKKKISEKYCTYPQKLSQKAQTFEDNKNLKSKLKEHRSFLETRLRKVVSNL